MAISRRVLLGAALAYPLLLPATGRAQSCGMPTPEDMEGPFYKAGAPARVSLVESASSAARLVLSGRVMSARCQPLANAKLDFWHADDKGEYDHKGFRYRGLIVTDAQGRYRLETNQPPPYSGRPRHIHVKLQPSGGKILTTQLYFPGESRGADRDLIMKVARSTSGLDANYDFVIF